MPRRRGNGPEHTTACRRAQEAAVRGLVVAAVTEAYEAHAAAQHNPAGSARPFLSEAALPAVRALNGAGATHLRLTLQAPQRILQCVVSHYYTSLHCKFHKPPHHVLLSFPLVQGIQPSHRRLE